MKLVMVLMLVALPLYCYAGSGCSVLGKAVEDGINTNVSMAEYILSLQEFIDDEDTANAIGELKQCFLSQSNETLDNFRVMMVILAFSDIKAYTIVLSVLCINFPRDLWLRRQRLLIRINHNLSFFSVF
ncbi:Secretoglobin family 2A member 1 [Camelus dromedarius]|uniref:Secretoglobin family 2A member 1 n=1 Tax=Camelus dromedarius TaxID=9838 RepID=A0A5N4DP59_CAMDR|nr:Secretoglobin family 2A member 1 [Camelus dromedarius]